MLAHHERIEESMKDFPRAERRLLFSLLLELGEGFAPTAQPVKTRRTKVGARAGR